MRWRWPPENSCGYFAPSAGSRPTSFSRSPTCADDLGGLLRDAEGAHRLGDDVERAPARIEAGVGVLEHHLDAAAQAAAVRVVLRIAHRHAVDDDFAGGRRDQADHHLGDGRFSRAGFADQREGLAPVDRERHLGGGREQPARQPLGHAVEPGLRDIEDAAEALHLDQRLRGVGRCGRRGRGHDAHAPPRRAPEADDRASRRPASAASGCSSGRNVGQGANARGQRGWNAQPDGIAVRRGIEPGICTSRSCSPVSDGIEPISPLV